MTFAQGRLLRALELTGNRALHVYWTTDSLDVVAAAGYFDEVSVDLFTAGDLLDVINTTTGERRSFAVGSESVLPSGRASPVMVPAGDSTVSLATALATPEGAAAVAAAVMTRGTANRSLADVLADVPVTTLDYGGLTVDDLVDALGDKGHVRVPETRTVTGGSAQVTLPAGSKLIVDGVISTSAEMTMAGDCHISGRGLLSTSGYGTGKFLVLKKGIVIIEGLRFLTTSSGVSFGGGSLDRIDIFIDPHADGIDFLRLSNLRFKGSRNAIHRYSGSRANPVREAQIEGISVRDAYRGDSIVWNIGTSDVKLAFAHLRLHEVTGCTGNAGFALDIAGVDGTEMGTNDYSNLMEQFTVDDVHVTGASEGIHIEYCRKFRLSNFLVRDIKTSYNSGSVAAGHGVRLIGCNDFDVDGGTVRDCDEYGVRSEFGVYSATYKLAPKEGLVRNISTAACKGIWTDGGVYVSGGVTEDPAHITLANNRVIGGRIKHRGACWLTLSGNHAEAATAAGEVAFELDFRASFGGAAWQPTFKLVLAVTGNTFVDKYGVASVSITGITSGFYSPNLKPIQSGNNFNIDTSGDIAAVTGSRVWVTDQSTPPADVSYQKGDVVVKNDGSASWLFTVGGDLVQASDNYALQDAATGLIKSTNLAWTNKSFHYRGKHISLSNGGGTAVLAKINRIFLAAALYQMELVDPNTGAILDLTGLAAGAISAVNAATYLVWTNTQVLAASGTSVVPNIKSYRYFQYTATGNITINAPTNPTVGDEFTIEVIQDATGGRTVTWSSQFKFTTAWSDTGNTANKRSSVKWRYSTTSTYIQVNPQSTYV